MHVFFIENDELLEKYSNIWKYCNIKKELDCKPIHNKKIFEIKKYLK